jgi:microcystin-dependent protein
MAGTRSTPHSPGDTVRSADYNNDVDGLATGAADTLGNSLQTFRAEAFQDFFVPGSGQWTIQNNLIGQRNGGVVYLTGQRLIVAPVPSYGFSQSVDTYVDIDASGTPQYQTVQNGLPAPALAAGSIRDAVIVTDATGIRQIFQTGRDSQRNYIHANAPIGTNQAMSDVGEQVGVIKMYGGSHLQVPSGYLPCDGRSLDRVQYAALFNVIGILWGSADQTHFNAPNLSGRAPVGYDGTKTQGPNIFAAEGFYGGEEKHILTFSEMPQHNHPVQDPGHAHGVYDPGHSHALQLEYGSSAGLNSAPPGNYNQVTFRGYPFVAGAVSAQGSNIGIYGNGTGITLGLQGDNQPHNNMQPYAVCMFIIKT